MYAYAKVTEADERAVRSAIWQGRGSRMIADYALDSGFQPASFNRLAYGNKQSLTFKPSDRALLAAGKNAAPESDLDEENFMAAGGKVKITYLESIRRRMGDTVAQNPETSLTVCEVGDGLYALNGKEPKTTTHKSTDCLDEAQREADAFIDFVDDMSVFLLFLKREEMLEAKRRINKVSKQPLLKHLLKKFRKLADVDHKINLELLEAYFRGEDPDNLPELSKEASSLFHVLRDMVVDF